MITIRRKLITATAIDPPLAVTAAELESHARAAGQPADQVTPYIYAAQDYLETICNRKFLLQTWAAYLDYFPGCDRIAIPFPPLVAVDFIKYTPAGGSQETLSTDVYGVSTVRTPGEVILKYQQLWPTDTLITVDPIVIQFQCGWADAASVPHPLRQAIRFLAAFLYSQREAVIVENGSLKTPIEIPFGVSAMIAPWRVYA